MPHDAGAAGRGLDIMVQCSASRGAGGGGEKSGESDDATRAAAHGAKGVCEGLDDLAGVHCGSAACAGGGEAGSAAAAAAVAGGRLAFVV